MATVATREGLMSAYLLTTGDGSDGDEWAVRGVYTTAAKALWAKEWFERERRRPDGSTYRFTAQVEVWAIDPALPEDITL